MKSTNKRGQKGGLLAGEEDQLLFCQMFYLKKLKIIDHADNEETKNAFELAYKDVLVGSSAKSLLICADTIDDKRSWIKDIKTIIKNYQREEYQATKEKLIKETEDREKRKKQQVELHRPDAIPLPDDNNDVWTLGMILWQMYTGKPIFEGLNFQEAAIALMTRKYTPPLDPTLPVELKELLEDCWLDNKELRPNYSMVFDRIRMLDCSRPKDPLAIAWAGRKAEEYSSNAIAQANLSKLSRPKKPK